MKSTMPRRFKLLTLAASIAALSLGTYRFFHPPLPAWLQPPPGSSVLVSRRFVPFPVIHGPRYYFRIHSPLPARHTAQHFIARSADIQQSIVSLVPVPTLYRTNWFSRHQIQAAPDKRAISIDFKPEEIYAESGDGEMTTLLLIWPEENGSTVEFFFTGGF